MAFVSLFFIFLLWPVWIVMIALAFLLPWLGMALTTVAAILLACNAGFWRCCCLSGPSGRPRAGWIRGISAALTVGSGTVCCR